MAVSDGKQFSGEARGTTLAVSITGASTEIQLVDASTFPDPTGVIPVNPNDPVPSAALPFVITIDRGNPSEEKILISGRTTNSLAVQERGYDGSVATSHAEQAIVEHTMDAFSLTRFMEHVGDPGQTDVHNIDQIEGLQDKVDDLDDHVDGASTTAHTISNVSGLQAALNLKATEADLTIAEGDIATNTGDISTNTGNISTNTGDIGDNAADIVIERGRIDSNVIRMDNGLGLRSIQVYSSPGTSLLFTKADYPWLRAVRVRAVGGGGGASGAPAGTSTAVGCGRGGRPGVYAESMISVGALNANETVSVGEGGTGGTGTANGDAGTDSSFGSHVVAEGANGSAPSFSTSGTIVTSASTVNAGVSSTGQIIASGSPGTGAVVLDTSNNNVLAEGGGSSVLGGGGSAGRNDTSQGNDAPGYGGGGGATATRLNASASKGGDGGGGVVIVELYA